VGTVAAAAPVAAGSRSRRDPLVPGQHGAWAFLALPIALAVTRVGWFPLLVPTTLAWVAAYPLSWAASGRLTARRPERFDRPLVLWGALVALAGLPVLVTTPWVVWVVAGYGALWLVNLGFARRRRERSLANDLVLVAECTLMLPVTLAIATGSRGWSPPYLVPRDGILLLVVACAVALTGSVLHVKSLIRERHDRRYAAGSRAFAVAGAALVALSAAASGGSAVVVVPFLALAARAWLVRGPAWRPARVGLVELAGLSLVVLAFAVS
jgi:YwiC-like protein